MGLGLEEGRCIDCIVKTPLTLNAEQSGEPQLKVENPDPEERSQDQTGIINPKLSTSRRDIGSCEHQF